MGEENVAEVVIGEFGDVLLSREGIGGWAAELGVLQRHVANCAHSTTVYQWTTGPVKSEGRKYNISKLLIIISPQIRL